LASYEKASPDTVKRDVYSRVRSAAKRGGVNAMPAELERATNKIIKLLRSQYVRTELAKNSKARITINVDLTFQPLKTFWLDYSDLLAHFGETASLVRRL